MADILGDTNILLRVTEEDDQSELVVETARRLLANGHRILYATQSLRELWNVATRPAQSKGGLGYSIAKADALASRIEAAFTLLHDTPEMHATWRRPSSADAAPSSP